jgi:AsmA family protein
MVETVAPAGSIAAAPPPPPPPAGRRRITPLGWVGRILLGILVAVFLVWLVLFITKGRFLKHPFERIVTKMSNRPVTVAGDFQLYFAPINLKFRAEGLSIGNADWAKPRPFFTSKLIETRLAVVPLIFGHRRLNYLTLDGADADLEWNKAGKNTWTFSDKPGKPLELPAIRTATVTGTKVRYRDPRMLIGADLGIETVKATGTKVDNAIRFSGTGEARGTPFRLSGALLSPNETIAGGQNRLQANIRAANTVADISGTLPGATEIEGAKLNLDVRGHNLRDLFLVAGIAVPETRAYRLRSALAKRGPEWRFTGMRGLIGGSDVTGRMTVRLGEPRMKLSAVLATRTLDMADAGPFVGYSPQAAGAAKTQGKAALVRTVGGTPRLLPDAPLRVDALKNFDADVKWTVRDVKGKGVPLSNIALALTLDNSLLSLSPLTFDMAGGHVASDISINARVPQVVTTYDIRLSPTPLGKLFAGWGVAESGTSGTLKARVQMRGVGNTLHDSLSTANGRMAFILPRGTFWTRNVQIAELDIGTFVQKMFEKKLKEPVQINCGLVAFTVKNGIAAADPILIDTSKNVMLGRGGFSFKNEALDLAFRADGKKFSVFSAQSPVGINGYFAKPGINPISGDLIARAGTGLGLAAVATPLAGVLAFIDVGDAKAASCGPILSGATAQAQRTTKGEQRDDVGKGTPSKEEDGKRSKDDKKGERKKFLGIF